MIGLLIFYWIFAALFMIGNDENKEPLDLFANIMWNLFLICSAPILFPIHLGNITKK